MKSMNLMLIFLNIIISIISIDIYSIKENEIVKDTIESKGIKIYQINREIAKAENKDMIITSELIKDNSSKPPIIIISTEKLPNINKNSHWICGKIGEKQCIIPQEFLKIVDKVYIGVFCENCEYSYSVLFDKLSDNNLLGQSKQEQIEVRNKFQVQPLRFLQVGQNDTTTNTTSTSTTTNSTSTEVFGDETWKQNDLRGAGVAGIILLIFFIFCVIIGSEIMMDIFVNNKYITQPLKIGRIEA